MVDSKSERLMGLLYVFLSVAVAAAAPASTTTVLSVLLFLSNNYNKITGLHKPNINCSSTAHLGMAQEQLVA